MHLLFTDPSTSPRTELGRLIFGVLYGFSSMALYRLGWLGRAGLLRQAAPGAAPESLGQVLDRWRVRAAFRARSGAARPIADAAATPRRVPDALGRRFRGDERDRRVGDRHPGQWPLFWERACGEGRTRACGYLADLERIFARPDRDGPATRPACGARPPTGCGRGVDRAGGGRVRAGLSARIRRGVRERRSDRSRAEERATDPRGLSDPAAGQQGTDCGPHAELYRTACAQGWPARAVGARPARMRLLRRGLFRRASDSARMARRSPRSP